jgi:hypothetical protein
MTRPRPRLRPGACVWGMGQPAPAAQRPRTPYPQAIPGYVERAHRRRAERSDPHRVDREGRTPGAARDRPDGGHRYDISRRLYRFYTWCANADIPQESRLSAFLSMVLRGEWQRSAPRWWCCCKTGPPRGSTRRRRRNQTFAPPKIRDISQSEPTLKDGPSRAPDHAGRQRRQVQLTHARARAKGCRRPGYG